VVRSQGLDAAGAGLPAHTERYEHLGEVRCFVHDLELLGVRGLEVRGPQPQAIA